MRCPKCKKYRNRKWIKGKEMGYKPFQWNDIFNFYKCKRCGHKWMSKIHRLWVDWTQTTFYDDIPQWFIEKLTNEQKIILEVI